MYISELLVKPKKPKAKKKRVLKEAFPSPEPQESIDIGGVTYTPPFYSLGNNVTDVNQQQLCTCVNSKVARALANVLWEQS
ncbi:hypothetical protein M0R04_07595 [Candidatus Dojkabacteria bacterium]|nr:hypothetical protein [Candidatus Dojkabacteria bacterium]